MKSTTGSKLAEQAATDYLKETQPSDKKLGVAFMFNSYAQRFGLPLRLSATTPLRLAKIFKVAILSIERLPFRKTTAPHAKPGEVSTRWLSEQIADAWGL